MNRFMLYLGILLTASLVAAKQKIVCSPYPYTSLEHGSIHRVAFQKYVFKCDDSHFLASGSSVRCYKGNWTSLHEPKCVKKQGRCGDPPVVDNGVVHGSEREVGATVKYICNEGFTLLGHSELVCSQSGHWNKRAPTCMDQSEPIESVAERLKDSFVTQLENYSADAPQGRLLDSASLRLGLELFLLIDRSSSVDPVHLEDAKSFTKFLLARFNVRNGINNENGTRAAVFAFGTEVQIVFDVDYQNISNPLLAASAIDTIQPNGGGTNMEEALTRVLLDVVKLRPKSKRALFLMTDGEPNVANPAITPQDLTLELKNFHDFEIFTVGIGMGINVQMLNELASEPPLSHVFLLKDYSNLNEVMKIIQDSKPPPPPIGKEQCGYSAVGEDRPWLVTLYVGKSPFRVCGGVLICEQWVLTTGSCLQEEEQLVDKQDVFVVLGERNLLRDEQGQTNFYVVDMRLHPHYDTRNVVRDNLSLLKLNLPATRYRPACLPPTDRAIPLHLNLKINASIAGWGTNRASKMTTAQSGDLLFGMNSTAISLSAEQECPIQRNGITQLCAGQGSRSCYGLVGSPLMAEDSKTHFQHVLGILADRTHCAKGQNQYIELTKYIGWINHVTSGCHLIHWGLAE